MDEILTAIKTALQSSITTVADADVRVVPSRDYIPNGTTFPAITIKDGDIINRALMGACTEKELTVYVIPWVAMADDEISLVGSEAVTGLIDLVSDIETVLNNNLLSISGLQNAWCETSAPSELIGDDRDTLQRKIITVNYEKQE